jgi:methanogenic corrinoid protein MtbC1
MSEQASISNRLESALLRLDRLAVKKILAENRNAGPYFDTVDKVVTPALERMGENWEKGKVSLSQMYMSARILESLLPESAPSRSILTPEQPRTAIANLLDFHILGKRIVTSALRLSGFELTDFGRMEVDELVESTQRNKVKVLLVSTLMLSSALRVKDLKQKLDQAGYGVRLIVGGAPFRLDSQLWKEVGADAMGGNSSDAIRIVREISKQASC